MVEQMGEGLAGDGDAQVAHVGEVGLGAEARTMDLSEHNLTVRAVLGAPEGNMALEGAKLAHLVALGTLAAELSEERISLKSGVALELGLNPGPIGLEGIGAGAVGARLLELAGEGTPPLVLAGSIGMHASAGSSLFLSFPFTAFTEHDLNLGVGLHRSPP